MKEGKAILGGEGMKRTPELMGGGGNSLIISELFAIAVVLCVPLFAQAQNVGIGTNMPSARLHIEVPSGFASPVVQVNQQGSATPYLIIQPNGNVGIGVASPSEALDVSGNIQFSGALMPGGNAGTVGQVLVSQGPGNAPVWQNATVVTDTPIVGVGTTSNPIGIMPGTNAGDVLVWNSSQWVIKPAPWDSICNSATANFVQKWTGTELCNSIIYDNGSQVGIGTTSPATSAIVEISSNNRGFLIPRLNTSQISSITNPAVGLMVYNTDLNCFQFYDGNEWIPIGECRQYPKSCKEWKNLLGSAATDGKYWIDPDGEGPLTAYKVYCNMTTNGGGWTLIASIADDGQDYWTWNNAWVHWIGNQHGSLDSFWTKDFQSWAWRDVKGDQVLFMRADDSTKFLIYDDILNNEPMVAKYENYGQAQITSGGGADPICNRIRPSIEYGPPSVVSGSWWEECGPGLYIKLQSYDTDGGGIDNAIGFIWRSVINNSCPYDDSSGGISICSGSPNTEGGWLINEFYNNNFGGSALLIFVR